MRRRAAPAHTRGPAAIYKLNPRLGKFAAKRRSRSGASPQDRTNDLPPVQEATLAYARTRFEVAKERAEAADAIMRVLEEYGLLPAATAAEYLRATLEDCEDTYTALVAAEEAEAETRMAAAQPAAEAKKKCAAGSAVRRRREAGAAREADTAIAHSLLRPESRAPATQTAGTKATYVIGADADVTVEDAGLSAHNVRPYTRRESIRARSAPQYPALDAGFLDAAGGITATTRASRDSSMGVSPRLSARQMGIANASSTARGAHGGDDGQAVPQRGAASGDAHERSNSATSPDSAVNAPGGNVRGKRLPFVTGSRTSWEEALLVSYDLAEMRESTSMMLNIIKRRPLEPPEGRYSHLLGRYMSWNYNTTTPAPLSPGQSYPPEYAAKLNDRLREHCAAKP